MQQVEYKEYQNELLRATKNSLKAAVNLSLPGYGHKYFKSNEGYSCLKDDGFMCGLFRFKFNNKRENITKLHQEYRINKGGYFLECYDGPLVELYRQQGFEVVSRVKFDVLMAPDNWDIDKVTCNKPDIVFMSLYSIDEIKYTNYENAYEIAKNTRA